MNKLRSRLALTVSLFALAGAAHALEVTYEDAPGGPLKPVSEQQRQTDLALGNCLKANGGRMVPRCEALREKSEREQVTARAGDTAPPVIVAPPQVIPGPVVLEPPRANN